MTGLAPLPVKEEGKCEYLLLMSLCCSGVQQKMKILQYFQSAQLKQLSQRLRVAENSSKGFSLFFFVQICSKCQSSFMRDSILRNYSSDTQMGDGDEESWSLCILDMAQPAPLRLMCARATGPATTFTTARKQLTSRALP